MDISMKIYNPYWETVFTIPNNTPLVKGRHGMNHDLVKAAGQVQSKFGCYAWGTAEELYYIGSFSKDYKRGNHKSNLGGRIHNYLQNHREKEKGRKNTNLMVFENINKLLLSNDVSLFIYKFESLEIGDEKVDYSTYCEESDLVRAAEQLLICLYRRRNQGKWNRE